jgi:hypothetical protein
MGISYTPLLIVGKEFENEDEAIDFLVDKNYLSFDEGETIKQAGHEGRYFLEEYLWEHLHNKNTTQPKFPSTQTLDLSLGEGYFIGYCLCVWDLDKKVDDFTKELQLAKENWKYYFKEEGEICHLVEIG